MSSKRQLYTADKKTTLNTTTTMSELYLHIILASDDSSLPGPKFLPLYYTQVCIIVMAFTLRHQLITNLDIDDDTKLAEVVVENRDVIECGWDMIDN